MAIAAHLAPDEGVPGYRRITVATGLAMFIDAALYLAVLPLLPHYAHEFGFGTLGAGLLIAAYPAAVPVVSLGSMVLVPRVGARRMALWSAVLMTAATIGFAFAPGAWALILSRFLQGVASGTVWTASMAWVTDNAPPDRRGRESGIVMGMLSAGSIAGPIVGALAAWIGTREAFLLVAVASAATVILTAIAPRGRPVTREPELLQSLARVVNHPLARAGIAVSLIDPLAFGTIDVLVPLRLGDMGVATTALAAAFGVGAALGSLAGPPAGPAGRPGRGSPCCADRRGARLRHAAPVRADHLVARAARPAGGRQPGIRSGRRRHVPADLRRRRRDRSRPRRRQRRAGRDLGDRLHGGAAGWREYWRT